MSIWQDLNGALHDDMDGASLMLPSWPVGMSKLSDAEVTVLLAPTLAQVQQRQIAVIDAAYEKAVQVSVSFTTIAGVTKTYQADHQGSLSSQAVLLKAYTGYGIAGETPSGFYWKSEDNTQVPFTLSDLGGLYVAMLEQGDAAFKQRETLKAAINAAATVAAVEAITWN